MKKAIIIGATSGIGRKLAEIFISKGYLVGITGRRTALLEEMKAANPEQIIYKTLDIQDTESIDNHLTELTSELGGLDILILSSGTGDLNPELSFDSEKNTINTNVLGFTAIADWTFNYFLQQKSGHFAAISSIGGLRGNSIAPAYSATKAYQINYLEGLRIKASKSKLPVFISDIRPGFVDTAMAKGEGLFWVVPVEKAAKQIINAIDQKKKVTYISKRWIIFACLMKLLPNKMMDKL